METKTTARTRHYLIPEPLMNEIISYFKRESDGIDMNAGREPYDPYTYETVPSVLKQLRIIKDQAMEYERKKMG